MFSVCNILFFQSPALSTKLASNEATCPETGEKFIAIGVRSTNNFGGVDLDLLGRAGGYAPQQFQIITCPFNGFSAYSDDFDNIDSFPSNIKDKLIAPVLSEEEKRSKQSQRLIPFWVKIENAAVFYETQGKDDEFLGNLFLLGSWLARLEQIEVKGSMSVDRLQCMKNELDRPTTQYKTNSHLSPEFRRFLYLASDIENCVIKEGSASVEEIQLISELYRRSGEHVRATKWLLLLSDNTQDETTQEILFLINKETEYQEKALTYFKKAIMAKEIEIEDKKKLSIITYLSGELSRRLGKYNEADKYYSTSEQMSQKAEWIQDYIDDAKIFLTENTEFYKYDCSTVIVEKNTNNENKRIGFNELEKELYFDGGALKNLQVDDTSELKGVFKTILYSKDLRKFAAVGGQYIKVFDSKTGKPTGTFRVAIFYGDEGRNAVLSEDGSTLVYYNALALEEITENGIIVCDANTGELNHILPQDNAPLGYSLMVISPNGKYLALVPFKDTVDIIDTDSGMTIQRLKGHKDSVGSVAFNSSGEMIVTGGDDRSLIIWDTLTGKIVQRYDNLEYKVESVAFSPDDHMVYARIIPDLMIIDYKNNKQPEILIPSVQPDNWSISPDMLTIAKQEKGSEIGIIDIKQRKRKKRIKTDEKRFYSISYSRDGNHLLVSGDRTATLRIFDVNSGEQEGVLFFIDNQLWFVFDSIGRYDCFQCKNGNEDIINNFVEEIKAKGIEITENEQYVPGLLSDILKE